MKKRDESFWRSHILAWQKSGERKKSYCERVKVNAHTFDYWQVKLKKKDAQETGKFIQVSESQESTCIELPNGVKVHVRFAW